MYHRHTRSPAAAVAALVLAAVIAGCGSSSSTSSNAPGVTSTSITFGTHQPQTGPAAPGYSEIAPASQAYFNYVNAHGGVFGRKIHLIIKNDQYNPLSPSPPCTASCCRATCSGSSRASARRRTRRS